jgi:predicted amidophosphoribosyltransferase
MSDLRFACPHCQQHLQAEAGYAGAQITCPACDRAFLVPGTPAPAPVPAYHAAPAYAASAAAAPVAMPPPPRAADPVCPSCGAAIARGAILCVSCGYNLRTGQKTVPKRPARAKAAASPWDTPWYATAYPYLLALVLVLGALYYLGRTNPIAKLAFLGVAAIYMIAVHIMVVVSAFREGAATGFLTLCIPIYGLYFVLKICENETLKVLYLVAYVLNLAIRFLPD